MTTARVALAALALALALVPVAACSGGARPKAHADAGTPSQHKKKPPRDPDDVSVYPPFAIRSDGVGLYLLDAPLVDVAHLPPEGARTEFLEIGGLFSWRMMRAEDGKLIVGADEGTRRVVFLAVLSPEIARTDGGLTVGSTGAALIAALGAERPAGQVVRTRRIFEFDKLPNVQFVTDAGPDEPPERARVIAVLLVQPSYRLAPAPATGSGGPDGRDAGPGASGAGSSSAGGSSAGAGSPSSPECRSGGLLAAVAPADLWAAAHPGRPRGGAPAQRLIVRWACLTGADPEAILIGGDELAVVGGAPGKLRRIWVTSIGPADLVQPLDIDGDGRDEIVALGLSHDDDSVAMQVRAWSWSSGKLTQVVMARPLVVTREQAAAAGATPAGIDLEAEVWPGGDSLVVGGLYSSRSLSGRVLAPITPVRVRLETGRLPPVINDVAPAADAGAAPTAPNDAPGGAAADAGAADAHPRPPRHTP